MRIRFIISLVVVLIVGFISQMKAREEIELLNEFPADTTINYNEPKIYFDSISPSSLSNSPSGPYSMTRPISLPFFMTMMVGTLVTPNASAR